MTRYIHLLQGKPAYYNPRKRTITSSMAATCIRPSSLQQIQREQKMHSKTYPQEVLGVQRIGNPVKGMPRIFLAQDNSWGAHLTEFPLDPDNLLKLTCFLPITCSSKKVLQWAQTATHGERFSVNSSLTLVALCLD